MGRRNTEYRHIANASTLADINNIKLQHMHIYRSITTYLAILLVCCHHPVIAQKTAAKPETNSKPVTPVKKPDYVTVYDTTYKEMDSKSATPPNATGYITKYDTALNRWEYVTPGKIVYNSLLADSKGNLYCVIEKKDGYMISHRVSKLVNKEWVDIQANIEYTVKRIGFTKDEALGMETIVSNYILSDSGWKETKEKVMNDKYNNPKAREETVRMSDKSYASRFLKDPTGSYVNCLAVLNDSLIITKKQYAVIITPRKLYAIKTIPLYQLDSGSVNVRNYRRRIGIFEVNGKKGLRNLAGDTIVYPVFESITLERGNSAFPVKDDYDFAVHLVGKNMDFKCRSENNSPQQLTGFIETYRKCKVCDGAGKLPDIVEKKGEEIKEWIPEKKEFVVTGTSTSTQYNSTTRSHVPVAIGYEKVTPGHFRHIGWKDKITPGAYCNDCDHGSKQYFTTRKVFYYDKTTNSYLSRLISETFK